MNRIKPIAAALLLTFLLVTTAVAGDIYIPGPPPAGASAAAAPQKVPTGAGSRNPGLAVLDVALNLLLQELVLLF